MKPAYYYHHCPTSNSSSPLATLTRQWDASTPRLARRHFPNYRVDSASDMGQITPAPDYDDQPPGYVVRVRSKGRGFPSEFSPSRLQELAQRRHSRSCDQLCRTEREDDDGLPLYSGAENPPPLPPRKPKLAHNRILNSPSLMADSKRKSIAIASPMTFRQIRNFSTLDKRNFSRELRHNYRLNSQSSLHHGSTLNFPVFEPQMGVYYERKFSVPTFSKHIRGGMANFTRSLAQRLVTTYFFLFIVMLFSVGRLLLHQKARVRL